MMIVAKSRQWFENKTPWPINIHKFRYSIIRPFSGVSRFKGNNAKGN